MPVSKLRRANCGDIGTAALYFTTKSDALAGMCEIGSSGSRGGACDEYPAGAVRRFSDLLVEKTGEPIPHQAQRKIITVTLLASTSN